MPSQVDHETTLDSELDSLDTKDVPDHKQPWLAQGGPTRTVLRYIFVGTLLAFVTIPFLWMVSTSFKPFREASRYPPTVLPERVTLGNYETLLRYPGINEQDLRELQDQGEAVDVVSLPGAWRTGQSFIRGYFNIGVIVFFSAVGAIVVSSMAAYAIAIVRFRGSDAVFLLILSTMMIPWMVVLLPRFAIFSSIGMVGTPLPLFLPELLGGWALAMFFYRQQFMGISRELLDAARIDGAGEWLIYRRIALPLAMPVTVAITVLIVLTKSGDLLGPLLYLDDPGDAVPTQILYRMILITGNESDPISLAAQMAGAVLVVAPILILFFFVQKHFVRGLTQGSVKG